MAAILITVPFSGIIAYDNNVLTAEVGHIQTKDSTDTLSAQSLQSPLFLERSFDLDRDGKSEKITITSTLEKETGNENTTIYIDTGEKAVLNLHGYFDGIEIHEINPQGTQIVEVRVVDGHSIDTTFYMYKKGNLNLVPISTSKPPYFYGIVSRNRPEFKDMNNDGALELFAYYRHFPPEKQRTVETYMFDGQKFIKTQEYEEFLDYVYF